MKSCNSPVVNLAPCSLHQCLDDMVRSDIIPPTGYLHPLQAAGYLEQEGWVLQASSRVHAHHMHRKSKTWPRRFLRFLPGIVSPSVHSFEELFLFWSLNPRFIISVHFLILCLDLVHSVSQGIFPALQWARPVHSTGRGWQSRYIWTQLNTGQERRLRIDSECTVYKPCKHTSDLVRVGLGWFDGSQN